MMSVSGNEEGVLMIEKMKREGAKAGAEEVVSRKKGAASSR